MPQKRPSWRFDEVAGAPLALHGRQITPIARVLRIDWLGGHFTWQHPLAAEVREGGSTYRLAIPDVTRRVLAAIVLAGGILAILAIARGRGRAS
jgi:hypothetical protein